MLLQRCTRDLQLQKAKAIIVTPTERTKCCGDCSSKQTALTIREPPPANIQGLLIFKKIPAAKAILRWLLLRNKSTSSSNFVYLKKARHPTDVRNNKMSLLKLLQWEHTIKLWRRDIMAYNISSTRPNVSFFT